eukprot:6176916-Pleurochrysis_carterae.AAC.1
MANSPMSCLWQCRICGTNPSVCHRINPMQIWLDLMCSSSYHGQCQHTWTMHQQHYLTKHKAAACRVSEDRIHAKTEKSSTVCNVNVGYLPSMNGPLCASATVYVLGEFQDT